MRLSKQTLAICLFLAPVASFAQVNATDSPAQQAQLNTITTAVPFLQIAPDSRCGAMGDAGVAVSPDANSGFWNPAKLAFIKTDMEASLSYAPWLRALVNDMSLAYLSVTKKLNKRQAFAGSLRYFTLGNITFTDESGQVIRDFKPAEWALDASFGQQFTDKFSGGISTRFVNSNLTGGTNVLGADSKPGRSVAADVALFYSNDDIKLGKKDGVWSLGMNISNIGAKMRYTNTDERDFIPANLKLGTALTTMLDEYNALTFALDFNKLLVPTPPRYADNGTDSVLYGIDPNVGVATGIVQSFYDAPGNLDNDGNYVSGSAFVEELREVNISGGMEYMYTDQFAFRTGYFYEHYTKGNRQFITLGAGLRYEVITIDMSYLISTTQNNPLANTLRFTLRLALDGNSGGNGGEEGIPTE